jgi:thioredoxin-like negative regulator of GroEL
MNIADSNEAIEKLINDNEMVLAYFGSENCSVCSAVKPKVEEVLKNYPKIKSVEVDVEKSVRAAAAYNVFTIPVVLVFIDGKETIREARHISIQDIDHKVARYYSMLFE